MRIIPRALKLVAALLFVLIVLINPGCQKTSIQYGQQYLDNGITNIVLVDSISPVVSTIYKDSVVTQGSGTLLIGTYNDPFFGKTSARTFLQLTPPALSDLLNNAQYDSLSLLMKTNGTYYGDTSLPVTLRVNQLTNEIKLPETQFAFYNTSSFPASTVALGTRTLVLRPSLGDSANIKLDDAKGTELYNMIKAKSDILKDIALFTNYLKGLQVSATSTGNIIGFKDSVVMRLYYHQTDLTRQNNYFDFVFYNSSLQFNNITADRTGTPLTALNTQKNELLSTASGNVGYLQSATGIYLKISFPTIRKLLERTDYVKIIRADLIVRPVTNSYNGFYPLPPILFAAATDGANEPGTTLTGVVNGAASTETGNLLIDDVYGANTSYSYDVTSYLAQEITNAAINKDGILLLPPSDKRYSSLNRLVIGDAQNAKNKLQLNVYYISVKK